MDFAMKITGLSQHKKMGNERNMMVIIVTQRGEGSNWVKELDQKNERKGRAKSHLGVTGGSTQW